VTGKQIHEELIKAMEDPDKLKEAIGRIAKIEGYGLAWETLRDERVRLLRLVSTAESRMYKEVGGDELTVSAREIDNRIRLLRRVIHELEEGKRVLQAHNIVVTAAKHTLDYTITEKRNALIQELHKNYEYLYTKEEK
jgi:hypothetical protein